MKFWGLLLIASFSTLGCGRQFDSSIADTSDSNGIYRGQPVSFGSEVWRYTVSYAFDRTKGHGTCTGVFIHPKVMLTATHCSALIKSFVRLTFYQGGYGVSSVKVKKSDFRVIKSPKPIDSNGSFRGNDLSLLIFKKSQLPTGYFANPPIDGAAYLASKAGSEVQVWAVGAGVTDFVNGKPVSDKSRQDLRFTMGLISGVWSGSIEVTAANGTGICSGDSGGPLYVRDNNQFRLIGITARVQMVINPRCGEIAYYSLLNKANLEWIKANLPRQ